MTMQNPGGQNRRAVRRILADHLEVARIPGLDRVYPADVPEIAFDDETGEAAYSCVVGIRLGTTEAKRHVATGPNDAGGIIVHYFVVLQLWHRAWGADLADYSDAQDDYDRIVDAIEDRLRGPGRDLGRPDVILVAGEQEGGPDISTDNPVPVLVGGSTIDRRGAIAFMVSQYLISGGIA